MSETSRQQAHDATNLPVKKICGGLFAGLILLLAPLWLFMGQDLCAPIWQTFHVAGSSTEDIIRFNNETGGARWPFSLAASVAGIAVCAISLRNLLKWRKGSALKLLRLAGCIVVAQGMILGLLGTICSCIYFHFVPLSVIATAAHMLFCGTPLVAGLVIGIAMTITSYFTDEKTNTFLCVLFSMLPGLIAGGINIAVTHGRQY